MTGSIINLRQYKFEQAERDLRLKLIDFTHRPQIQAQIGEAFYIWKNDPELIQQYYKEEEISDITFTKFFDWFIYDFKLIDIGTSVIELFYEQEADSLSNFEKSILRDWLNSTFSYFDVEGVATNEGCNIRDIFTDELIFVTDNSASKQVKISDIIGARLITTDKNTFFSGVLSVYPQTFKSIILDFYNREFKEFKKTFGKKSSHHDFLKNWGFLIGNYLEHILEHSRFLTPDGDELVFARADYSFVDLNLVVSQIREIKAIQEVSGGSDELRVFVLSDAEKKNIDTIIEVEVGKLSIQAHSTDSFNRAKAVIEKRLKGLISHRGDSTKHPDSLINHKSLVIAKQKKPPFGVRNKKEMERILDEYYDDWIDEPIDALNGKSPREALKTKYGRNKLISILSELERLYQHAKKMGEPYYDIKKLRNKLKL
ncbi:MAG: hypothetical protein WBD99_16885 [Thermodesulfobacteriota bacterium]